MRTRCIPDTYTVISKPKSYYVKLCQLTIFDWCETDSNRASIMSDYVKLYHYYFKLFFLILFLLCHNWPIIFPILSHYFSYFLYYFPLFQGVTAHFTRTGRHTNLFHAQRNGWQVNRMASSASGLTGSWLCQDKTMWPGNPQATLVYTLFFLLYSFFTSLTRIELQISSIYALQANLQWTQMIR